MFSQDTLQALFAQSGGLLPENYIVKAEVLLDSTIHGKLAAAFHKRCDNVEDIYTIVSLKDAAGTVTHVLGGYSALGWTNESIHAHDPDAFVFVLKSPTSSEMVKGEGAEGPNIAYAPDKSFVFGGDHYDLACVNGNLHLQGVSGNSFQNVIYNAIGAKGVTWASWEYMVVTLNTELGFLPTPYFGGQNPFGTTAAEHVAKVTQYAPAAGLTKANILVFGAVGAGKSSLISTLDSAIKGRISHIAPYGSSTASFTRQLVVHEFYTDGRARKNKIALRLWDAMGWDSATYQGGELEAILDGHIPHKFDLSRSPYNTQPEYVARPPATNKVHAALFVLDAADASNDARIAELQKYRKAVMARNLPVALFVTKVDRYDEMISSDLSKTYMSTKIAGLIDKLHKRTGIAKNLIWPVKSFAEEAEVTEPPLVLLLRGMQALLDAIDDYIEVYVEDTSDATDDADASASAEQRPSASGSASKEPSDATLSFELAALGLNDGDEVCRAAIEATINKGFDLPSVIRDLHAAQGSAAFQRMSEEQRTAASYRVLLRAVRASGHLRDSDADSFQSVEPETEPEPEASRVGPAFVAPAVPFPQPAQPALRLFTFGASNSS